MSVCLHAVPDVIFSLRGASIPTDGSRHVLITDIDSINALIYRSGIPTTVGGNWFLHPTQMSTDGSDRIVGPPVDRGWSRNRGLDSGHRLVRLWRQSATAEEGVFTCDLPGINTPVSIGVYHASESYS